MVMINDKFSISEDLYDFLMRCKEKMFEEDSMVLGILWGDVGSGKSLKAQHMGYVIDTELDIDRVAFDKEEFIRAIIKNRQKVIVGDEGISLFFSRASMTKEGRLISELMDQIRQKNLCIIICVPKLLSLDWSILESANFVGYVWESKKEINGKRRTIKGNLALYPKFVDKDYKMEIIDYLKIKKRSLAKKYRSRPEPFLTQPGEPIGKSFKKPFYPVGEYKYRTKKEAILDKYMKPQIDPKIELINKMKKNCPELTDAIIGKSLNLTRQWVNTLRNRESLVNTEKTLHT